MKAHEILIFLSCGSKERLYRLLLMKGNNIPFLVKGMQSILLNILTMFHCGIYTKYCNVDRLCVYGWSIG